MPALFLVLPAVVFVWVLLIAIVGEGDYAFDFHQFWQGARDVADGHSPYPSQELLATASDRLDPTQIQEVFRFPYPAPTAIALLPFGVLPYNLAAALFVVLLTACVPAALWVVGVRDWRIFGLTFGMVTVGGAVRLGTLTPLLLLGIALLWRYRDRRVVAAVTAASLMLAKLFLWPMVVWLAATRRLGTAALAVLLAAAVTLLSWAAIGFAGFADYPDLLQRLTHVVEDRGYSMVAFGALLGVPIETARVLPYLVGLPLLAAAAWLGNRTEHERASFTLAVVASIVLTPIVWLHYFVLLLVPLAIARPRFSWPWLVMLGYWAAPTQENEGDLWRVLVVLTLTALLTFVALGVDRKTAGGRARRLALSPR